MLYVFINISRKTLNESLKTSFMWTPGRLAIISDKERKKERKTFSCLTIQYFVLDFILFLQYENKANKLF